MPNSSGSARTHRASAQRRRAALLDAARELVGEIGAGAVTHRAVAKRAGVPLSTTSYFFDSIDELVAEALKDQGHHTAEVFDDAERAWVFHGDKPTEEVVADIAAVVADRPLTHKAANIERFLAATRDPGVQESVLALNTRLQERLCAQIERAGESEADALAWAILQLIDGSNLHRVAGLEDGSERLTASLRLLLAGALLGEEERNELFRRVDSHRA